MLNISSVCICYRLWRKWCESDQKFTLFRMIWTNKWISILLIYIPPRRLYNIVYIYHACVKKTTPHDRYNFAYIYNTISHTGSSKNIFKIIWFFSWNHEWSIGIVWNHKNKDSTSMNKPTKQSMQLYFHRIQCFAELSAFDSNDHWIEVYTELCCILFN